MSISFQTNIASLVGQNNLSIVSGFQTRTIERLTSGYRIYQSGDDPAGLAVANGYRSSVAELTQGLLNANDGVSSLQTIDSGLDNIGMMLDRLKTLATESASGTFSGDRNTLNIEYANLLSDIDRQAQNIQLNQGGAYNSDLSVYIGSAPVTAVEQAKVFIDLSGQGVDSTALGLNTTSVAEGGNQLSSGGTDLRGPTTILHNETQTFTVNYTKQGGTAASATITVTGAAGGIAVSDALGQINNQLSGLGITASINQATGYLQFSGNDPFSVSGNGGAFTDGIFSNAGVVTADNQSLYSATGAVPAGDPTGEVFSLTNSDNQTVQIALGAGDTTAAQVVADMNQQSLALGITASVNSAGGIQLSSQSSFTATQTAANGVAANNVFGAALGTVTVTQPVPDTTATGDAISALTAIQNAVQLLGQVQGKVGSGENRLQYAIDLANSQITNYSAAESRIRDADVAAEAANLTKSQVLQQASIAAMAQANSAPQAVLRLLQQG